MEAFNANSHPGGKLFINNHEKGLEISSDKKASFGFLTPFLSNDQTDLQTRLQFSWDFATEVTISIGLRMKAKRGKEGNTHWPKSVMFIGIIWRN